MTLKRRMSKGEMALVVKACLRVRSIIIFPDHTLRTRVWAAVNITQQWLNIRSSLGEAEQAQHHRMAETKPQDRIAGAEGPAGLVIRVEAVSLPGSTESSRRKAV